MKKSIGLFFIIYVNLINAQISDFKDINFTKADNIAKLNRNENLKNLPLLCYKLTYKLSTDVEKFRAIYTWVATNIKADAKTHNKVTRMREKFKNDSVSLSNWNTSYKKIVFKKLVKHKKTMCTGYAYLIKEMASIVNIESKIINGYGRTVSSNIDTLENINHSWNSVKLNNKWYLCDATWSSGYIDENGIFITDYNTGYFLTDPVLFSKNHYPLQQKWFLSAKQTASNFVEAPIIYGEIFKHQIISLFPEKMKLTVNKKETILFKLNSLKNNSSKKITLIHFLGNTIKKLKIDDLNKNNHTITFKHKFKWKGTYDIHLKIDDDIVATYVVKVTD
ncbi:transglutaminase domain-containing protein [Tenacibaculum dicentrarchi]|uniref:transglutaminase domain-containing protein n=1 Tax=Tenacibaculum dicentrarchi TaxID=669041 RepID=UPI0035184535